MIKKIYVPTLPKKSHHLPQTHILFLFGLTQSEMLNTGLLVSSPISVVSRVSEMRHQCYNNFFHA